MGLLLLAMGCFSVVAAYPAPDPKKAIPKFVVNLDSAPEHRWDAVVEPHKHYIKDVVDFLHVYFLGKKKEAAAVVSALNISDEYQREMTGIARVVGVSYDDIVLANLFYEIDGMGGAGSLTEASCTSIIVQRANGTVYLARNQDYPPPFSPLMVHLYFQRKNVTIYQGTGYAGTIGLDTGLVPGGWGASINARDTPGLTPAQATARAAAGGAVFPMIMRLAMATGAQTWAQAVSFLMEAPLIRPGYINIAGVKPGEGVVLSRNSSSGDGDAFYIDHAYPTNGNKWFLVQTNTDHWLPAPNYPLFNVSRRDTAIAGVTNLTHQEVDMLGLYDVLSTPPTYNPTTIHTNMMNPFSGEHYAYKRHGPL